LQGSVRQRSTPHKEPTVINRPTKTAATSHRTGIRTAIIARNDLRAIDTELTSPGLLDVSLKFAWVGRQRQFVLSC
jgi:hypothetical protein